MLRRAAHAVFRRHAAAPLLSAPRRGMFIQTQPTPNAHALMFMPGREVMPGGRGTHDFPSLRAAAKSPLARRLLGVSGVRAVFLGPDFITITKGEPDEWAVLKPEVFEVIMEFFTSAEPEPVVVAELHEQLNSDTAITDDDDEVVAMIKELLESRVKPAVAEDGGSILYRGFDPESGVVSLELQGACSTCSSSSITLKSGVENMLKHYIPEVKAVEEVFGDGGDEVARANHKALSDVERKLKDQGVLRP